MQKKARLIAFHLPQFHPTPENDAWWGKGFTEWTNVARAKPLFHGHHQPNVPADLGFYDLRLPEARHAQAELAREYGIEGFCYYHYWFGEGRRILERPFNEILQSGEPNFPFCLCWANHSWNTAWQGTDKMLIEQKYPGMDDHAKHFDWLLKAFHDKRYITINGRPILIVWKPDNIPEINRVVEYWRLRAQQSGLPGLHLIGISHNDPSWDPVSRGFDGVALQTLPKLDAHMPRRYVFTKLKHKILRVKQRCTVYDYQQVIPALLRSNAVDYCDYPIALPRWDNTPRSGVRGLVLQGSTPELFRTHLREAISRVINRPPEDRVVFIKAWNEWAEGNYVEPDQEWGRKYLDVIRDEVNYDI